MTSLIILGVIAAIFTIGIIVLRSGGGVVALSLMGGFVLNTYASSQLIILVQSVVRVNPDISKAVVRLVCILLPALLVLWFLRGISRGKAGIVNVPIGIAAGLLAILFAVPQLPESVRIGVEQQVFWQSVVQYQVVLVSVSVLLCLVQFWTMRPKKDHDEKKSKH